MYLVLLHVLMCLWGCNISPCESITLTSKGVVDGKWKDSSSVTLVCTIPPLTRILVWYFNSSKVAECTIQYCRQISTGDGTFTFGFDTENGIFEWSISPVDTKKHHGQMFKCFDGSEAINITAIVTDLDVSQNDRKENNSVSERGLIAALVIALIALIFAIACAIAIAVILYRCRYINIKRNVLQLHVDSTRTRSANTGNDNEQTNRQFSTVSSTANLMSNQALQTAPEEGAETSTGENRI